MPLVSLNSSLKSVKVKDDIISTDISHEFISMIDAAYRLHRSPPMMFD